MNYVLYTDGACPGNPGPGVGGIGVNLILPEELNLEDRKISKGYNQTTNNRMELRAGIEGLRLVRDTMKIFGRGRLEWLTDSKYVADNIFNVQKWRKGNKWITSSNEPVSNVDLWKELEAVRSSLGIYPSWISREENKIADGLAGLGAKNPTHKDFGYNPGRVGKSLGGKGRVSKLFKDIHEDLRIRIYKGDGQVSRSHSAPPICKIRFQIVDENGSVSEDKHYIYASADIYNNLHRHHEYVVHTEEGHVLDILESF